MITPTIKRPVRIETERLIVREFTEQDTDLMLKNFNEPDFIKFIADKGIRTEEDALNRMREVEFACYQRDGFGSWLVELKNTGEKIGSCGIFKREPQSAVELGYAFISDYFGKGYCTEAVKAVLTWAKQHNITDKIIATTEPSHQASIKVLLKSGFDFIRCGQIEAYDGLSNIYHYKLSDSNN